MDLASIFDVTGSPIVHLVSILDGELYDVVTMLVLVVVSGIVISLQPAWNIGEWGVVARDVNVAL